MSKRRTKTQKTNWYLSGGIVLGIGALLYAYLMSQANKFSVGNIRYKIGNWQFTHVDIDMIIPVVNQAQLTANVNNFMGDLLYMGRPIATLDLLRSVEIRPNTNFELPVKARLDTTKVLGTIIDLVRSGKLDTNFTVKGWVVINQYRLPINQVIDPLAA